MQIFGDIKKTQIKVGLIQHEGLEEVMRKKYKRIKKARNKEASGLKKVENKRK